jgi:hypothetical protein
LHRVVELGRSKAGAAAADRDQKDVRDQMRVDRVEIFSDATNAAVVRHPGRRFPGLLVQGDTLYSLCRRADLICREVGRGSPAFEEANDLRNALQDYLSHYKAVQTEHGIALPFSETP